MKKFLLVLLFVVCSLFNQSAFSFDDEEILIIFDASTSMANEIRGKPKYVHAINSAKRILSNMSAEQKIGLRIIGLQIDTNMLRLLRNPKQLCLETQLVSPISSNNIFNINKYLDLIMPLGVTPLTYSLQLAIENDFSSDYNTLKHIILITDGGESCGGDPCRLIQDIAAERNDIKVDIIAISVRGEELIQLKCIAEAGYGELKNVENPDDFDKVFSSVITTKTPEIKTINPDFSPLDKKFNVPQNYRPDIIYKNYAFEFNN